MESSKLKSWKKVIVKPKTLALIALIALVVGFTGYIVYKRYFVKDREKVEKTGQKDERVANKLDGVLVDTEMSNRHPLAIIVENHTQARPQSGLDRASIVYEAIAEGGITRFMAVYGPQDAEKVGPVRSARTYFMDWASEFNAFIAHVGGNLDALDQIKKDNMLDLDQFSLGTKAYWREPDAGKAIEHTMYTSTLKLYEVAMEKNWPKIGDFKPLKFKEEMKKEERTAGQKVTVDFSSPIYKVVWQYDKEANGYLRTMAGRPHEDAVTGEQLLAKNIIIQKVERREAITAINENGYAMTTIGSGDAKVFVEGKEIAANWTKENRTARTIFTDKEGKEIDFTPGKFWIEIAPPEVFDALEVEALTEEAPAQQ